MPTRVILALIGIGGLIAAAAQLAAPTWWGVVAAIALVWMGFRAAEGSRS
jgi:hypothetical protein